MNKEEMIKALNERFLTHDDFSFEVSLSCLLFQGGFFFLQLDSTTIRDASKFFVPLCTWEDIKNPLNAPLLPFVGGWNMNRFCVKEEGTKLHMSFGRKNALLKVDIMYSPLSRGFNFSLGYGHHPLDYPIPFTKDKIEDFFRKWEA